MASDTKPALPEMEVYWNPMENRTLLVAGSGLSRRTVAKAKDNSRDAEMLRTLCHRYNAHAALVAERGALRAGVFDALTSLEALASDAGDVDEWNDGGHAREACRRLRTLLDKEPARD